MASSASDLLKLELQATGENSSTWGTKANTVFARIEEAIAGYSAITLAGITYVLDDTQYSENSTTTSESHLAIIKATGSPGASRQITVPLRTKTYLIWNAVTTYDLTVAGATGDAVTIPNGMVAYVFCDGTNVEFASPPTTTAGVPSGYGTADSPQFTGIEVGAASDTTLTRSAAGVIAVEGVAQAAKTGVNSATSVIAIALGDELTAAAVLVAAVTFHMPYAFTLTDVIIGATTAPTGSVATFDLNEAGTTVLSTKVTVDVGEKTSGTAATPPVISDAALAANALMTVDIDGIGSTVAGAGYKIYLVGYQT